MAIDINISSNFDDVVKALDDLKVNQVLQAARFAINRTLITLRKESTQRISEKLNIKQSTLKDKYIVMNKAKGGKLGELVGSLDFSGSPIPVLEFVKGAKTALVQKGIPVAKRRKLKVEITPGKPFIMKGAFIQRVHSLQVFKGRRSKGFHKQGIRSLAYLLVNRGIGDGLVTFGQQRFTQIFLDDLRKRMNNVFETADNKSAANLNR